MPTVSSSPELLDVRTWKPKSPALLPHAGALPPLCLHLRPSFLKQQAMMDLRSMLGNSFLFFSNLCTKACNLRFHRTPSFKQKLKFADVAGRGGRRSSWLHQGEFPREN